jgi:hypothetical protein
MPYTYSQTIDDDTFLKLSTEEQQRVLQAERNFNNGQDTTNNSDNNSNSSNSNDDGQGFNTLFR